MRPAETFPVPAYHTCVRDARIASRGALMRLLMLLTLTPILVQAQPQIGGGTCATSSLNGAYGFIAKIRRAVREALDSSDRV
jgi:hypothetical protein